MASKSPTKKKTATKKKSAAKKTAAKKSAAKKAVKKAAAKKEAPKKEVAKKEPAKKAAKKAAAKKEAPKKEAPKKEAAKKEAPAKEEAPKKVEEKEVPKKEEPKKPVAKKEAPQKAVHTEETQKEVEKESSGVLDLLDPAPKKKSRRERAAERLRAEEERKRAILDEKTELDKQKESALNLFEEQEKKAQKKKAAKKVVETKVSSAISIAGDSKKEPEPEVEEKEPEEVAGDDPDEKIIHLKPPIIIKDLANEMKVKPLQLIKDLMGMEIFASVNKAVEPDVAEKLCEIHGFTFEKEKREKGAGVHKVEEVIEEPEAKEVEEEPEDVVVTRAPVVTVMGHVDHGKTTLLDTIRKARVADGEAGGITQHIKAYQVFHNDQPITFIDTPGHQAFTEMRQRGAQVTDLVILVIAADDGIMPTTKEAIAHAKAADVTLMIAINKCDLPNADPNKVKQQLQAIDLAPEEWGGSTICCEISAAKGEGIDELLELVALQAEILELKANPKAPARATVVEARTEKGRGPTAQVIVTSGTLKVGMAFICGLQYGKVRALVSDGGDRLKEAGPSMPVEIQGFDGIPSVGDEVVQMKNEREAKKLGTERQMTEREAQLQHSAGARLESMFSDVGTALLRIVLKTDVQGSAEAIVKSIKDIKSDKVKVEILHSAAGPVTESDITLASASDAIVIGFNQKVEGKAVKVAKQHGVQVKLYSIIYELVDQVKEAMLGQLDPETRENVIGHATVKQVFKVSKGKAAGCIVTDGKITRKARARVLRGRQPVYDGGMDTLKRFQDDVSEVKKGLECGIRLGNFNDYEEDDVIEAYELEKVAQTL